MFRVKVQGLGFRGLGLGSSAEGLGVWGCQGGFGVGTRKDSV